MQEQNTALFGAYIRTLREARGWSLRELAGKAEISHTTVDNIEKGYDPRTGRNTNITLDTLTRLGRALSISTEQLLACLDGMAKVTLARPVEEWHEDEREDMMRERGGVREYLRLKWGRGRIDFPACRNDETAAMRVLFGDYVPTPAEWEQVKQYAKFIMNK